MHTTTSLNILSFALSICQFPPTFLPPTTQPQPPPSSYPLVHHHHSSHQVTADLRIQDVAKAAHFFCSDGVVITGQETAHPVDQLDLEAVRDVTKLPIIVGSGVNEENLGDYRGKVDGVIVGSHFKTGGHWENAVDERRVESFMVRHRHA